MRGFSKSNDGYRVQLHLIAGGGKAFARNGLNLTKRFSTIVGAFETFAQAMDGRAVVIHDGRTSSPSGRPLANGDQDCFLHCAFDLLGRRTYKTPQAEWRAILQVP